MTLPRDKCPRYAGPILTLIALLLALWPILVPGQQKGTLTIVPPSSDGGVGDITAVGDCSTGDCFQSTASLTFFASPPGGGIATFRAITEADLPSALATDLELTAAISAHAAAADAHHTWPVGIGELADDITCSGSQDVRRNSGDTGWECYTPASASGDVVGPASSTTNAFALFADTTGKLLANSTLTWDGSDLTFPVSTQIRVPYGTGADPSMEWPNGSGISAEAGNSALVMVIAGNNDFYWQGCGIGRCLTASSSGGPRLYNLNASSTVPTVIPRATDPTSGLGGLNGAPALIVSGQSKLTASAEEVTIHVEQVNLPASQTCTDEGTGAAGALTITVSAVSNVEVTQADPHGCAASLSEAGATRGAILVVTSVSNAGGTLDFADSAGVQETGAGCSLGLYGVAVFRYITDRWLLQSCVPIN